MYFVYAEGARKLHLESSLFSLEKKKSVPDLNRIFVFMAYNISSSDLNMCLYSYTVPDSRASSFNCFFTLWSRVKLCKNLSNNLLLTCR